MNPSQVRWKKRAVTFLVSQSVTLFGSTLVQMAIVWYVTMKTSSGVWVAAFTVCSYLPQFLISFLGGVWADRYSRKALIIGADSAIALITLAMVIIMPYISSDPVLLTSLLIMSALRSFGAGIQTPSVNAVIPQLVPEKELMRYNGINATMQSVVQFAAPAAAGTVLSFSTLSSTLLIDVATAAVGIGILSCLIIPEGKENPVKVSVISDMKAGIRYAFSERLIARLLVIYSLFIFLSVPAGFLAQLFVSRVYGDTYWYLTAVELVGFGGMTAGGLIMGIWGGFKSRVKTLLSGILVFGLLTVGMGLSRSFILYLIMMLIYGIALTMVQTATTTMIQEKSDEKMHGRVFGLLGSAYSGFLPLGMALFGPLADILPLQWIMIFSGGALMLIALIMCSNRHFRDQ